MSNGGGPVIGQYFDIQNEGSRTWTVKFRSDVPYRKLTRLFVWPAWLQDGLLVPGSASNPSWMDRLTALTAACRAGNPSAEVFVSSGYDDGSMYLQAAQNPARFADGVVAFLRANGLDGYDMDWENGLETDGLNALLTALRTAFDAAGAADGKRYGLSLAVWPFVQPAYDLATMAKTLDAINIMSYGTQTDLPPIVEVFGAGGFPNAKMIGGIDTESGYPGGTDTLGPGGTIAQKSAYALQNGLAGMMEWRLDNDYVVDNVSTYQGAEQLYASMQP